MTMNFHHIFVYKRKRSMRVSWFTELSPLTLHKSRQEKENLISGKVILIRKIAASNMIVYGDI